MTPISWLRPYATSYLSLDAPTDPRVIPAKVHLEGIGLVDLCISVQKGGKAGLPAIVPDDKDRTWRYVRAPERQFAAANAAHLRPGHADDPLRRCLRNSLEDGTASSTYFVASACLAAVTAGLTALGLGAWVVSAVFLSMGALCGLYVWAHGPTALRHSQQLVDMVYRGSTMPT